MTDIEITEPTKFKGQFELATQNWSKMFQSKDELDKFNLIAWQVCKVEGFAKDNAPVTYYRSLWQAIHLIATLGLKPGKQYGHFDLHIENNLVICRPMYQGYLEVAYRDPNLLLVKADVVRDKDTFKDCGLNQYPEHSKDIQGDGKIVGAYAVAQYKDGSIIREIATKAELDKIKQHIINRSYQRMLSKLATEWEEEWSKVKVIRRLLKSLRREYTANEQTAMNELDNQDYDISDKLTK